MKAHGNDKRAARGGGQGQTPAAPFTPPDLSGDRVAKALARAGVASRRDIEKLIAEGRVALNGQVLTTPAVKVSPGDLLTVDGKLVEAAEETRLWRYHKPNGLVTSHKDPAGRPTVFQALPADLPRVISVGRLDLNSEGLLLLTNDGALSRALELPTSGWVRRYRARAFGQVTQERLDKLRDGITVEGVSYGSIEAKLDKVQAKPGEKAGANLWITIAIREGKNREVRRVLEAVGLKVNRLIRLAYGPFSLGNLQPGEVEEVGPRVIREQLAEFLTPETMPKGDRVAGRPMAPAREDAPTERRGRPQKGARSGPPRQHGDLRPKGKSKDERPSKAYPHKGAKGRIENTKPAPAYSAASASAPAPERKFGPRPGPKPALARGTFGSPRAAPREQPERAEPARRENGAAPERPDSPHRFGEVRAPAERAPARSSAYGEKSGGKPPRPGAKPHGGPKPPWGERSSARAKTAHGQRGQDEKAEPKAYKAGWAKPKFKPKPKPGPKKPRS